MKRGLLCLVIFLLTATPVFADNPLDTLDTSSNTVNPDSKSKLVSTGKTDESLLNEDDLPPKIEVSFDDDDIELQLGNIKDIIRKFDKYYEDERKFKPKQGFSGLGLDKYNLNSNVEFDIPIILNSKVESFINYFQNSIRGFFERSLKRGERVVPLFKRILKENDLPEDLAYLSLIESGFNPNARSRANAVGAWQFIRGTGSRYGLKINSWVDERKDYEKSSIAAAAYLKELYSMFNSWFLAAASYNAGENRILKATAKYRTSDFWELTQHKHLARETKEYVPKLLAATIIAKDPAKFGFEPMDFSNQISYQKVRVPDLTDIRIISKACNVDVEKIKELNPELLRGYTPPDYPDYLVKIPIESLQSFRENFDELRSSQPEPVIKWVKYKTKRGDTLGKVATMFEVDPSEILNANKIKKGKRLAKGIVLKVPVISVSDETAVASNNKEQPQSSQSVNKKIVEKKISYKVQKGDTLQKIAKKYNVSAVAVKKWNHIKGSGLTPGREIIIYSKHETAKEKKVAKADRSKKGKVISYKVKKGDSIYKIALKYDVEVSEIKNSNNLKNNRLKIGEVIKIVIPSRNSDT